MKKKDIYNSNNNIMVGFMTDDNYIIESVYSKKSKCLCISTQIGCRTHCVFCASGNKGFIRNLDYDELIEQVRYFEENGMEISQIHFGGIGEPLRNIDNINKVTLELNKYSFQVTTSVPSKESFLELSKGRYDSVIISLHSAIDKTRKSIIKNSISVNEIEDAIKKFKLANNSIVGKLRISYLILSNVNTSAEECASIILFAKRVSAKLLLLGYNPTPGNTYLTKQEDYLNILRECIREHVNVEDCVNSMSRRDKIGGCGTFAYGIVDK